MLCTFVHNFLCHQIFFITSSFQPFSFCFIVAMVLSLVTDLLTGSPCSLDLLIEAETNRKMTFLTKDR